MVNGIVVVSTTFVAVLVVFIYLCELMNSQSRCNCISPLICLKGAAAIICDRLKKTGSEQ